MTARLNEHEDYLDDRETMIAILNSQNAVAYEEITDFYDIFLFPNQIRKHSYFNSLKINIYIYIYIYIYILLYYYIYI